MRCADEPLLEDRRRRLPVRRARRQDLRADGHAARLLPHCAGHRHVRGRHASTSRILGGLAVWRARVAAGCVVAGRKAQMLVRNSGLIQACSRLDRATHARAAVAALAGLLM